MTPEVGFVVFLALLVGPTALWLVYRGTVSHSGRVRGGLTGDAAMAASVASATEDGEWTCRSCRSVNRPGAKRCYSCRTSRDDIAPPEADPDAEAGGPTARPIPIDRPVARPIPVAIVPSPPAAVPIDAGTVAAGTVAGGPVRSTASLGSASRGIASPGSAAPGIAPAAALAVTPAVVPAGASAPVVAPAAAPEPDVPPVCPFIGLRDDPTTRLDFPDPRNLCHAAVGRRGLGWRGNKPDAIDPAHQATLCLTATHRRCARYPAAETGAPRP